MAFVKDRRVQLLISELETIITSMTKKPSQWGREQDAEKAAWFTLLKKLEQLRGILEEAESFDKVDFQTMLAPFLDVILSDETSGYVTYRTLVSVHKFLLHHLFDGRGDMEVALAISSIADAVTHAKFFGTDPGSDEAVLMMIMQVLQNLLVADVGRWLTNDAVCQMMQSCFHICFEIRLSELLRRTAAYSLLQMTHKLFSRLHELPPENDSNDENAENQARVEPTTSTGHVGVISSISNQQQHDNIASYALPPNILTEQVADENLTARPSDVGEQPLLPQSAVDVDLGDINNTADGSAGSADPSEPQQLLEETGVVTFTLPITSPLHGMNNAVPDLRFLRPSPSHSAKNVSPARSDEVAVRTTVPPSVLNADSMKSSSAAKFEANWPVYGVPAIEETFRFLTLIIDPFDKNNNEIMISTGLDLLTVALEASADAFHRHAFLLRFVKNDLTKHLSFLLSNDRIALFSQALRLTFLVVLHLRTHIKWQFEAILSRIIGVLISEPPRYTMEHREIALQYIVKLFRIPNLTAELFYNFDCDPYGHNIFEDLIKLLSKSAFPIEGHVTRCNLLCIDALIIVIAGIESAYKRRMQPSLALHSHADAVDTIANADELRHQVSQAELAANKRRKELIRAGTEEFNKKPSRGISYLQQHGVLPQQRDAQAIANFLRQNPFLDKRMIGDYLSQRDNTDVLNAFIVSFNFSGVRIDDALRQFLEAFRLPGESKQIETLLDAFSSTWFAANNAPFANTDAAFTLSYAVIMLNTDQHNTNARKQNQPMQLADFKKNLTKVNGGADFDAKLLENIFSAIKSNEIVMPEERSGIVRDNYLWKILQRRTTAGSDSSSVYQRVHSGILEQQLFQIVWGPCIASLVYVLDKCEDMPNDIQHILQGFHSCASVAAHYCMSDVFDNIIISLAKSIGKCLTSVRGETAPHVGGSGNATTPHGADGRISAGSGSVRSKHSGGKTGGNYLTTGADVNASIASFVFVRAFAHSSKAQMATLCVFQLSRDYGDMLKAGWKNIVDVMLLFFQHRLLPDSLVYAEDFLYGSVQLIRDLPPIVQKREASGIFSAFYSYLSSGEAHAASSGSNSIGAEAAGGAASGAAGGSGGEDDEASKIRSVARECVEQCAIGQLILDSKFLTNESLQELMRAIFYAMRSPLLRDGAEADGENSDHMLSLHDEFALAADSAAADYGSAITTSYATNRSSGGEQQHHHVIAATSQYEQVFIFCLEILTRILIENRDRFLVIWPPVYRYFIDILPVSTAPSAAAAAAVAGSGGGGRRATSAASFSTSSPFLVERVVASILRLNNRLLMRDELCPLLIGSLSLLSDCMDAVVLFKLSRQITFGLFDIVKTNWSNIRTRQQWRVIFDLIQFTGAATRPRLTVVAVATGPLANYAAHPQYTSRSSSISGGGGAEAVARKSRSLTHLPGAVEEDNVQKNTTDSKNVDVSNRADSAYDSDSGARSPPRVPLLITANSCDALSTSPSNQWVMVGRHGEEEGHHALRPRQASLQQPSQSNQIGSTSHAPAATLLINSLECPVGNVANDTLSSGASATSITAGGGLAAAASSKTRPASSRKSAGSSASAVLAPYKLALQTFAEQLALHREMWHHDSKSFFKAFDTLVFLIVDLNYYQQQQQQQQVAAPTSAPRLNAENLFGYIDTLRVFAEAGLHGGILLGRTNARSGTVALGTSSGSNSLQRSKQQQAVRPGKPIEARASEPLPTQKTPGAASSSATTTEQDPAQAYEQFSLHLIDMLYAIHCQSTSILFVPVDAIDGKKRAVVSAELWLDCWRPTLQTLARLCVDSRRQVRTTALTYLQRALLLSDMQSTLSPLQWLDCFDHVLLPLLASLVEDVSAAEVAAFEELRMRALTLVCKVFLQHLPVLLETGHTDSTRASEQQPSGSPSSHFVNLWQWLLAFMFIYMKSDWSSDVLQEAITESLKNMLLVMMKMGNVFNNADNAVSDTTATEPSTEQQSKGEVLWNITCQRVAHIDAGILHQVTLAQHEQQQQLLRQQQHQMFLQQQQHEQLLQQQLNQQQQQQLSFEQQHHQSYMQTPMPTEHQGYYAADGQQYQMPPPPAMPATEAGHYYPAYTAQHSAPAVAAYPSSVSSYSPGFLLEGGTYQPDNSVYHQQQYYAMPQTSSPPLVAQNYGSSVEPASAPFFLSAATNDQQLQQQQWEAMHNANVTSWTNPAASSMPEYDNAAALMQQHSKLMQSAHHVQAAAGNEVRPLTGIMTNNNLETVTENSTTSPHYSQGGGFLISSTAVPDAKNL